MITTPIDVAHEITIETVDLPAGTPLRAVCLCGWSSPIVAARPHAFEAGAEHVADAHGAPTRASHCSCGRLAREVTDGGRFGPTGYCGAPNPPLDPCDCGQGSEQHDRSVCHVYGRGLTAWQNEPSAVPSFWVGDVRGSRAALPDTGEVGIHHARHSVHVWTLGGAQWGAECSQCGAVIRTGKDRAAAVDAAVEHLGGA